MSTALSNYGTAGFDKDEHAPTLINPHGSDRMIKSKPFWRKGTQISNTIIISLDSNYNSSVFYLLCWCFKALYIE